MLVGRAGHFYPRPPRGGRRRGHPHAQGADRNFYPRPPRGGRPRAIIERCIAEYISIHALREEGDRVRLCPMCQWRHFYPRPPRGGRPLTGDALDKKLDEILFLSTPSARRATATRQQEQPGQEISIHALREEGDPIPAVLCSPRAHFYPRPPRGGRPALYAVAAGHRDFYPRPPRGGRRATPPICHFTLNFYPRPPRGGRRPAGRPARPLRSISIHALREEGDLFRRVAVVGGIYISIHALREEGDQLTEDTRAL